MNDTDILRLVADGNKLQQIHDLTGLPKGAIVKVAREHGYTFNASADRFVKPVTPLAAVKPAPQTGADAEQGKAGVRPATRDLIDEGKASSVARVRRAAERVVDAITRLEMALDDPDPRDPHLYVVIRRSDDPAPTRRSRNLHPAVIEAVKANA